VTDLVERLPQTKSGKSDALMLFRCRESYRLINDPLTLLDPPSHTLYQSESSVHKTVTIVS